MKLSGLETVAYLSSAEGREQVLRWEEIGDALLSGRLPLARPDLLEVSNFETVRSSLTASRGAPVVELPTVPVRAGVSRLDKAKIRELFSTSFGIDPVPPARVALLRAAGGKPLDQEVTALLVAKGFEMSAYATPRDPHQEMTKVIAWSSDFVDEARQIRKMLGVGRVFLGGSSPGIADVTVLLGADYLRT